MLVLLLLHVARGRVGPPCLTPIVGVGVGAAPSIRHLPSAGWVRGMIHAKRPDPLLTLIQTRSSLGGRVQMEGQEAGCRVRVMVGGPGRGAMGGEKMMECFGPVVVLKKGDICEELVDQSIRPQSSTPYFIITFGALLFIPDSYKWDQQVG